MENNAIKEANRKALPKFLIIMVVCTMLGGLVGFFSAHFGLDTLSGSLKEAGAWFGMNAAPWLMVAVEVLMPVVSVLLYQQTKTLLNAWDGEDDTVSDAVDTKLTTILWLASAAMILGFFLFAAFCSVLPVIFETKENGMMFFITIIAFFVILFETIFIQQKCVDATKKMNPEKTASVYDMKFQKKWVESCDEAEKVVIGKCAYKAYAATNMVCAILASVLMICALEFETGLLPALVVCLIWLINVSVYSRETIRYSKAGNRIS